MVVLRNSAVVAAHYLLPIADREPLSWILREQRTAFGEHRAREAQALEVGDVLYLYTTRGCFRNPTRDRGRVIGRATVKTPARRAPRAPAFGGREFPYVVELAIDSLAPLREGLKLAPLVPRLPRTFPDPRSWSVRLRRALVALDPDEAALVERELAPHVVDYANAIGSYDGIAR
ncbi:MAG: hypothetical protein NZL88_06960 [Gaiellaceae bacterium]|nr:hypothetical protein [Gaiellaceae bacterium]